MSGYIKDNLLRGFDKVIDLSKAIGYSNELETPNGSGACSAYGHSYFDIICTYPPGNVRIEFDKIIINWREDSDASKTVHLWIEKTKKDWESFRDHFLEPYFKSVTNNSTIV